MVLGPPRAVPPAQPHQPRRRAADAEPFLADPEGWIAARYGGGKFKLNLHHGMHFVNTKNFKPAGEPRWAEVPALDLDA